MATFKTNCTGKDIEDAVLSISGIVEDLKYIIANYATIDYVNQKINEIENKKSSAASNMGEKAIDSSAGKREGKNYIKVSGSGNHGFSYDDELGDREFSQYLSDKGYTQYLYDYYDKYLKNNL